MKRLQDYFAALTSPFLAPADVCDALAHALFCAVRLLREAQFQRLFDQLVAWCWDAPRPAPARVQLFFVLFARIAGELQDVFTRFFVALLDRTQTVLADPKGRYRAAVPHALGYARQFLASSDDIKLAADQWKTLVAALGDLVAGQPAMQAVYDGMSGFDSLKACLARVCHLTRHFETGRVWQLVQKQLMMHFVSDEPLVRLNALRILHSLYVEFDHDFAVACMPEFLPRLFELLEHEDEDLQQLATDTKLLIQRITNEQLDTYMM
eukprot:EG_transcript_19223